ncbi:hypothetical protein ACFL2Q_10285, partial [Thermodesulfobacteriota bacterium]
IPNKNCSIVPRAKVGHLCRPNSADSGAKSARLVSQETVMRYLPALIFCVIGGGLWFFPNPAHPDDLIFQEIRLQGGCIAPQAPNENIRLDVMQVTIRGKRDSYSVDGVYHLFNNGETTTVEMGVPKYGRPDEGLDVHSGEPIVRDFLGFDAWVNGRKAAFVEVRDFFTDPRARPVGGYCHGDEQSETRWMVKKVTFTGKATTTIRVR